jgi:hypothetical protein
VFHNTFNKDENQPTYKLKPKLIYMKPRDVGVNAVGHMGFFFDNKDMRCLWTVACEWLLNGGELNESSFIKASTSISKL